MAKEKTRLEIVQAAAQQHRQKADENYIAYQTTGMGRYDTQYWKHDCIAEALEKYLDSEQIRIDASHFKNVLANFADAAATAKGLPDADRLKALDKLASELVWRAKMEGIYHG